MPDNPERPFDHHTLKIGAVFVPEGAEGQPSRSSLTNAVGHDAVKIPAVLVPDGGARPGYPYEPFGPAEFRPSEDDAATRTFTSWQTPRPEQPAPEQDMFVSGLPRTRYRFGAALSGQAGGATPPNPASGIRGRDPVRAGMAVWRGLARIGRSLARQHTGQQNDPAAAAADQNTVAEEIGSQRD